MRSPNAAKWRSQGCADNKSAGSGHGSKVWFQVRQWLVVSALATICLTGLRAQQLVPAGNTAGLPSLKAPVGFEASDARAHRLWQVSLITLSVANVLDVHSSLGKRELNSALANSSGTLGSQGILLKSAFQGGLMGIEYLVTRGHSRDLVSHPSRSKLYRSLAIINFAASGVLSGIAAHNYTVPRTRP